MIIKLMLSKLLIGLPDTSMGFRKLTTLPPGLQLNKVNTTDTEAPFVDLHFSFLFFFSVLFFSFFFFFFCKNYKKRDDFDFAKVIFLFFFIMTFLRLQRSK